MSGRTLNILLVEDNPDHAELVRRSLEPCLASGLMHHVEDGDAALDYLFGRGPYADRGRYPLPDLVLLDLRLPRTDGLEVLRQVKSHPGLQRLAVVVLTTSDAERDVAMAYEHRADGFVTKPVDLSCLSRLLAEPGFPPGTAENTLPVAGAHP